jgi:hypothetical protein
MDTLLECLEPEEFALDQFGSSFEKTTYVANVLFTRFPRLEWDECIKAAGHQIKNYGFVIAVTAAKEVVSLESSFLYAKLQYMSRAFYATAKAARTDDAKKECIQKLRNVDEIRRSKDKLKSMLKNTDDALMTLFLDDKISKAQFDKGSESEEEAVRIIEEVMGSG